MNCGGNREYYKKNDIFCLRTAEVFVLPCCGVVCHFMPSDYFWLLKFGSKQSGMGVVSDISPLTG